MGIISLKCAVLGQFTSYINLACQFKTVLKKIIFCHHYQKWKVTLILIPTVLVLEKLMIMGHCVEELNTNSGLILSDTWYNFSQKMMMLNCSQETFLLLGWHDSHLELPSLQYCALRCPSRDFILASWRIISAEWVLQMAFMSKLLFKNPNIESFALVMIIDEVWKK